MRSTYLAILAFCLPCVGSTQEVIEVPMEDTMVEFCAASFQHLQLTNELAIWEENYQLNSAVVEFHRELIVHFLDTGDITIVELRQAAAGCINARVQEESNE